MSELPWSQILRSVLRVFIAYFFLTVGTFLMARSIGRYVTFDLQIGFLAEKQSYIGTPIWIFAFYVHVFSSLFTLFAGFFQFSRYLLSHYPRIHRILGKFYVYNILFVNAPMGLILAIYANGGILSKIAFSILAILWFWFTVKALIEALQRRFETHREFMIRSFALTCSAITLRTWKGILSALFTVDAATLYMIDAWLGFVPNLIVAEVVIRSGRRSGQANG